MNPTRTYSKPTKKEQLIAKESYVAYMAAIEKAGSHTIELKISDSKKKIVLPHQALDMLKSILKAISEGQLISVVPTEEEVSTQKAAEILGCSRPHLVKLLEDGKIPFNKVGKHRRIKMEDITTYKNNMKENQRKNLVKLMKHDAEQGLYEV